MTIDKVVRTAIMVTWLVAGGCSNPGSKPYNSPVNAPKKLEIAPAIPQAPDEVTNESALNQYNTYRNSPEKLNGLSLVIKHEIYGALLTRISIVDDANVLFLAMPAKVYYDPDLLMPVNEANEFIQVIGNQAVYSEPAIYYPTVAKRTSGEKSVAIFGLGWISRKDLSSKITIYAENRAGARITQLETQRKKVSDKLELEDIASQIEVYESILSAKK